MSTNPLLMVTEIEVRNYVSQFNDPELSEFKILRNLLAILSSDVLGQTIAALKNNIITFNEISLLPTLNDSSLISLINMNLGLSTDDVKKLEYRKTILPANINMTLLASNSIGNKTKILDFSFFSLNSYLIKPNYDFSGKDSSKFASLNDAKKAFQVQVQRTEVQSILDSFRSEYLRLRAIDTNLLPPVSGMLNTEFSRCVVVKLISDIVKRFKILESSKNNVSEIQKAIFSKKYEKMTTLEYKKELEKAIVKMVEVNEANPKTGYDGMITWRSENPWVLLRTPQFTEDSAYTYFLQFMFARVHLPVAYGVELSPDIALAELYTEYLEIANSHIMQIIEFLNYRFSNFPAYELLLE